MYTSERFILAKEAAEKLATSWFVLSAKHGLLLPNDTIERYDVNLVTLDEGQKNAWAHQVRDSVADSVASCDRVTFLCSDIYTERVLGNSSPGFVVRTPLRGKSKNQQIEYLKGLLGGSERGTHLERFYEILSKLKETRVSGSDFGSQIFREKIPAKGIYFFFEPSEVRSANASQLRVVRVGTHGVSAGSKSTLRYRIGTHFGTRAGGGNHRSSIMRLHIGAAMLNAGALGFTVENWGEKTGPNFHPADLMSERRLESEVSRYLAKMSMICIAIGDESSASSDRAYIEQNSIALLAGINGPIDVADSNWLGSYSVKTEIRESSLWNVNCVYDSYDPDFLNVLEEYAQVTLGNDKAPTKSIAPEYWYDQRRGRESKGQQRFF